MCFAALPGIPAVGIHAQGRAGAVSLPARQAVPLAVWLHGAAGDRCAQRIGEYGMTPTDLAAVLPEVLRELVK